MFTDYALRLNLKGIASLVIPVGQEVSHEFIIEKKTIITGAEYFRTGNDNDTVTLNIKENGKVIATLADSIFLSDQGRYEFYQAVLNIGHSLEIIYKNNGLQESKFRYNIISHREK